MCYPDLNVEVVSSGIVARLPLERRELCKEFPCCFEGIYELGRWMNDLGMKMCCVRIVSHDHAMLDMVVKVAEQLGMGGIRSASPGSRNVAWIVSGRRRGVLCRSRFGACIWFCRNPSFKSQMLLFGGLSQTYQRTDCSFYFLNFRCICLKLE